MSDTPAVNGYMTIERGWVPIDDLTREEAIEAVKELGAQMHRDYAERRRRAELKMSGFSSSSSLHG